VAKRQKSKVRVKQSSRNPDDKNIEMGKKIKRLARAEKRPPPAGIIRAGKVMTRKKRNQQIGLQKIAGKQQTGLQKIGCAAKKHLLQGAFNMMKKPTGGIQGTHDTGDGVTAGMPNWKMGTDVMRQANLVRDYNIPGIAHQWASRVVHHLPKSL